MRAQLLFLIVFFNFFLAHNQIILNKIDSIKTNDSYQLISVDILGELFFLEDNNLRKGEDYFFSDSSLGPITKVDFYNNFKLKVWYQDFNTLVILDNYLNEITRIQTTDLLQRIFQDSLIFLLFSSKDCFNHSIIPDQNSLPTKIIGNFSAL